MKDIVKAAFATLVGMLLALACILPVWTIHLNGGLGQEANGRAYSYHTTGMRSGNLQYESGTGRAKQDWPEILVEENGKRDFTLLECAIRWFGDGKREPATRIKYISIL